MCLALARLLFFDFADRVVTVPERGFWKGAKEFLEAFGLAEFACEGGMDARIVAGGNFCCAGETRSKTMPHINTEGAELSELPFFHLVALLL
jgi:hypothetical protein